MLTTSQSISLVANSSVSFSGISPQQGSSVLSFDMFEQQTALHLAEPPGTMFSNCPASETISFPSFMQSHQHQMNPHHYYQHHENQNTPPFPPEPREYEMMFSSLPNYCRGAHGSTEPFKENDYCFME